MTIESKHATNRNMPML